MVKECVADKVNERKITQACQSIIDADCAMWRAIDNSKDLPLLNEYLKKVRAQIWCITVTTAPPIILEVLKRVYSRSAQNG